MIKPLVFLPVLTLLLIQHAVARPLAGDANTQQVKIAIENVVNGKKLELNRQKYVNAHGDTFSVRMYKYYISNIILVAQDGKEYKEKESYHLVNESKPKSKEFVLENVPAGTYSEIRFTIGVDSLHNVSGAQGGQLDPINAMFWDWNTGYIMAKFEGYTPDERGEEIAFHIGGYAGENSVLRDVSIPFSTGKLQVAAGGNIAEIYLNSDLAEWFKSPKEIDFTKTSSVTMEGAEAVEIANNYADMFKLNRIVP